MSTSTKTTATKATKHVRIWGHRAELLHKGLVGEQEHFVVRRDNGDVQVWTMDPCAALRDGPRCVVSGTIEQARDWWRLNA